MAFQWSDKLEVGHELIDSQHLELLRRFNNLSEACRERRGSGEIENLFEFLDSYVQEHFREEEQLMRQTTYPDLIAHAIEHHEFIGSLQRLKEDMELKGATTGVVIETCHTLLNWVISHIHHRDTELGAYLKNQVRAA